MEVGVAPVPLGTAFALYVEESEDIGTGMAFLKVRGDTGIDFRIRDHEGNEIPGTEDLVWHTLNQDAKTLREWFGDATDNSFLDDFKGTLFLRTQDGSEFAPIGLRFGKRKAALSAVPVIRLDSSAADEDCPPNPFGGC